MRTNPLLFRPVVLVAFLTLVVSCATVDRMEPAQYERAEQFLAKYTGPLIYHAVSSPQWLNDVQLLYKTRSDEGENYFVANAVTSEKTLAFDTSRLIDVLNSQLNTDITKEKFYSYPLRVVDENTVSIHIQKQIFHCDFVQYLCALYQFADPKIEQISPDGKKAVFIKDHNLWVRYLDDGKEVPLTTDGVKDFAYATNNAGWLRSEKPVVKWSPDSTKIATFKHDSRGVGEMGVISTAVGHPDIDIWKYPLPGDETIFTIQRLVIDLDKREVIMLDMAPDDHRSTITDHVAGRDGQLLDIHWAEDSSHFAFVSSSRDHKTAILKIADADTGNVDTIFTEVEESFFESGVDAISWRYLDASNEILWFSQRSDWGHLYLVDVATGKIKHPITRGDWTVLEVLHVDQNSGKIIFTGAGREGGDPYFKYLYSVKKDGSNLTLLSPEKVHHRVLLSKDASYFLDRRSTPTTPEQSHIRSIDGETSWLVEVMDTSALEDLGWKPPTPFVVKDRNGDQDIHGLLYKPSSFDPGKSYPVINYLYPGPQVGSIRGRHFRAARGDNQAIAELGFIVIEIDALGTPGRSKSFHEFYYQNMGDSGIPDQVAAIKQLAEKYLWIDDQRVGIWGHSGGGFASTRALLTFPDFYSVAVSQAGNHDNRNYADEWGEKYHGMLLENKDGSSNYDSQANQLLAEKLKGKLLITHGTTDTNVLPSNTLLVVDALIQANKDFDMLMLPNTGHGYARSPYMMRKRWDYFVKHLLSVEPPKEFVFYQWE